MAQHGASTFGVSATRRIGQILEQIEEILQWASVASIVKRTRHDEPHTRQHVRVRIGEIAFDETAQELRRHIRASQTVPLGRDGDEGSQNGLSIDIDSKDI